MPSAHKEMVERVVHVESNLSPTRNRSTNGGPAGVFSNFQPRSIDRQLYRSAAPRALRKWFEVIENSLVPLQARMEADEMQSKASNGCIVGPFPEGFLRD